MKSNKIKFETLQVHAGHQMSSSEQLAVGIDPGLFRVSVGIEHIDDIINDFEHAFKQVL